MKIKNLALINFRNHQDLKINFDDNTTMITGDNGSGKSTILESIYILSVGRLRTSKYDRDLIQYDKDFCTVRANIQTKEDDLEMELQIIKSEKFDNASTKKAKINKVVKSIQYFTGVFNSVLFSPSDIQLITGSPSERRKYVDNILSQIDLEYKRSLNNYLQAIRQRNKLLENINKGFGGQNEIGFYTDQILNHGKAIQEKRLKMFEDIGPIVSKYGKDLNNKKTDLKINYRKNEISEERLNEYKSREIAAMTTLLGPHRDDFEILFDGHDISNFGSRGEQRSCVLSLKIAEMEFIEKKKGDKPVLLLDDIFSELDGKHQEAVTNCIENNQTILTSTSTPNFLQDRELEVIKL
ncbi:MAG TPA: DNA replication and repair protein RecF [Patescibacteria group bacterium]|nr:DNA replication and repair protein RecF [bacterium]HRY56928.1 DNA replication and repair protein RecF [Patescibacteria group bacterium]